MFFRLFRYQRKPIPAIIKYGAANKYRIPKFRLDASIVSEPLLTFVSRVARHMAHWANPERLVINKTNMVNKVIFRLFIITIVVNNMDLS